MTPGHSTLDVRSPPPAYFEALKYPVQCKQSDHHKETVRKNIYISSDHDLKVNPREVVYLYKPNRTYYNLEENSYVKLRYIYSLRGKSKGKSVVVLEALPETLASSNNFMGVETYAKIEVVESTEKEKDNSMCIAAESAVKMVRDPEMFEPAQTNGKPSRMPANGLVYNDKMIVESLLTDVCNLPPPPGSLLESDSDEESEISDTGRHSDDQQVDLDLENLTHALENGDDLSETNDERCVHFEESTPFLNDTEAHCSTFRKPNETMAHAMQIRQDGESASDLQNSCRKSNNLCEHKMPIRQDSELDYADSGYSDKPYVKDAHVLSVHEDVIYSEPDRSSSDLSVKCDDEAANQTIEKHQRTLKRTKNGEHHTVYDLCPSESFYNSDDSTQTKVKRDSISSNDPSSKVGPKFSSLTDANRSRNRLSRDSSVTFHKPIIVSTDKDCSTCKLEQQDEAEVRIADAEPLVSEHAKPTSSTETLSAQLMLEDSRSYYRRKAADRGTLYCAACGISVVATIVFLLIYFS